MKTSYIPLSISLLLLQACSWYGYKLPTEQDFQPVNSSSQAYVLGVQNFGNDKLSSSRLEAVRSALSDVQEIFASSKEFENIISNQSWVSSCDGDSIENISGEKLLYDLRNLSVKVSVYPKKPWMAIGLTDTANSRIAIDPQRIDDSNGNEVIDASWLVETTAHEITHLVLNEKNRVKYRDAGHGKEGCSKNELASYRVGRAAQAVWIAKYINKPNK